MAWWGRTGQAHKRATILGAGVVTAAVIGVVVALPHASAPDRAPTSAPEQDAVPVKVSVGVSEYGIGVGMKTSFTEDLTLSSPSVQAGESRSKASLWPLDGNDHEGEDLDPLVLPKGTPVTLEGGVRSTCDGSAPAEHVVFAVHARGNDGTDEVRRFTSRRPGMLAEAIKKWCSMGPTVSPGGGSLTADGDAKADVTVTNPGPGTISVEVPTFSQGGATWYAASAAVPAGERVTFVVKGSGVRYDGSQELPWEKGRLLIDGKPVTLPTPDDGWLG